MHTRSTLALLSLLVLVFTSVTTYSQIDKKGGGGFGAFAPSPEPVESGREVYVHAVAQHASVPQGGRTVIAVTLSHAPTWKTWPAEELNLVPAEIAEFVIPTWVGVGQPASVSNYGAYRGPTTPPPAWVTRTSAVQWPDTYDIKNPLGDDPAFVQGFKDDATAYFAIEIADDAPLGPTTLTVGYYYQACDATTCLMPVVGVYGVPLTIVAEEELYEPSESQDEFADYQMPTTGWTDLAGSDARTVPSEASRAEEEDGQDAIAPESATQTEGSQEPVQGSWFFGLSIPTEGAPLLLSLAAFGALGGFILNLTPCVLPVIPIKVMTLSKHAGESKGRAVYLGVWMFFGVTAFWAALSLPVIFLDQFADPSRVFGIWWFTLTIGLIVMLLAFGLMGMFAINLPQKTYMINPKADNASGSFCFGIMTAILGLPCFGFVAGALVPTAAAQGPVFSLTLFTAMGVGMAAPYLVLAAFPDLLKFLPKTGAASDLVKQVMGMLLFAAGVYFFVSGLNSLVKTHPYALVDAQWTFAALFASIAGLWLVYRTVRITKKIANRVVFTAMGAGISAASVFVGVNFLSDAKAKFEERQAAIAAMEADGQEASYFTTLWNDFSPQLLDSLAQDNKVVVIDFTADWCINCKALKKAVLDVEPVLSELKAEDTVMVKVDFTGTNPQGDALLERFGRVGIPTLAVVDGSGELVWVEGSYLSGQVLDAIEKAREQSGI